MEIPKNLYEASKVFKDKNFLRSYLFLVSIDGKDDVIEQTCFIRDITWSRNEIIIDTIVDEFGNNLNDLVTMKNLKISFLSRTGKRIVDDQFEIKRLKKKYPLKVGHEENSLLVFRLIYEY
jgi:hypothetical protein